MVLPLALEPPNGAAIAAHPAAINYLPETPAPLPDAPELSRRTYEFAAELGVALPHCAAAVGTGCAALHVGPEFALVGFVRSAPHFAFGACARRANFSVSPAGGNFSTAATSTLFALGARVYAFESGRFDPYLELDLGAGSLSLAVRGESARRDDVALSPAVRSALGLNVLFTTWLRGGVFLSYARYFPGSVSECSALGCSALRARDSGVSVGNTALGVALAISAGEML